MASPHAGAETFIVTPIATVSSSRIEATDDDWGDVEATLTLREPHGPSALAGLEAFSHLEVIYLFHLVDPSSVNLGARVPRGNPAWPRSASSTSSPFMAEFGPRRPVRQPAWSHELMARYW